MLALLPTTMISSSLADRLLSSSTPILTHIHVYTRSPFDLVFLFMLIIAVGTVAAAAWLSAAREREEMKQRRRGEPVQHVQHEDSIDARE